MSLVKLTQAGTQAAVYVNSAQVVAVRTDPNNPDRTELSTVSGYIIVDDEISKVVNELGYHPSGEVLC